MKAHATGAAARMEELVQALAHHNHLYYTLASPVITDQAFDALLKELEALEAAHPELARPDSPTQRVGGVITKEFPTYLHRKPMLSLGNTYSLQELVEFDGRVQRGLGTTNYRYLAQLKIDGVAMSLHYHNGVLTHAVTRGNGTQGDEVTANVRTIRSIPLRIISKDVPPHVEVRGEVFLYEKDFLQINREREELGEPPFMNPRNTTAGTLKLQDSAVVARRPLKFIAYYLDAEAAQPTSDSQAMALLQSWGFPISAENELCEDFAAAQAYVQRWNTAREKLPFATDGVVLKLDDFAQREELGFTAKSPRWAIAFKYAAEQAQTVLQSVTYQVGRTGYITPVANLQPVLLAGTTVKRASLYNYDEIARLDLHQQDVVTVEKSGEIIPKIVAVHPQRRAATAQPVLPPSHCPACATLLARRPGEVAWYCPNVANCPPQVEGRIAHFASRRAMDIQHLGSEIIHQLVVHQLIRTPADLYTLTLPPLLTLERFAEKSATNLLQGIAASNTVPFNRVLYALGIRYVGEGVADKLAKHFHSLAALQAATQEGLAAVQEIGERIAQSVVEWFAQPGTQQLLAQLQAAGLQFTLQGQASLSDKLAGKRILISGTFVGHSRDALQQLVQQHGGENAGSVSKNVDYLLAGENMGPAKLAKAQQLGIQLITLQELLAMVGPQ